MKIAANVGPHLRYPFDLLPGGWLVVEGPDDQRREMVDGLRYAAYGEHHLWRVPPVFTGRPALDDPRADVSHHQQVVRCARQAKRFVISDGCWLGRIATEPLADEACMSEVVTARRRDVWGDDTPSLLVLLLDGDARRSRVMIGMDDHTPRLLVPSRTSRDDRWNLLFAEMRRLRLHGRLT